MRYKKIITILSIAAMGLVACNQNENNHRHPEAQKERVKPIQRFGMVTGLKPGKLEYYKQLHENAWPAVLQKIKDCNIQNYSVYLKEIDGKLLLFSYFEYAGDDFDAEMKKMAADSITQRWWKETDPCQLPLPDAASKKQIWSSMEEVFHEN